VAASIRLGSENSFDFLPIRLPSDKKSLETHPQRGRSRPFVNPSLSEMKTLGKGCLAGWIANKWGGGCLGTIILFIIAYWLLTQVFG
jgi:hypothetical protein